MFAADRLQMLHFVLAKNNGKKYFSVSQAAAYDGLTYTANSGSPCTGTQANLSPSFQD